MKVKYTIAVKKKIFRRIFDTIDEAQVEIIFIPPVITAKNHCVASFDFTIGFERLYAS